MNVLARRRRFRDDPNQTRCPSRTRSSWFEPTPYKLRVTGSYEWWLCFSLGLGKATGIQFNEVNAKIVFGGKGAVTNGSVP